MAAPATITRVASAALNDIKNGDSRLIKTALCVVLAAAIFLSAILYYLTPLSLIQGVTYGALGGFAQDADGNYIIDESNEALSARVITHYQKEAEELEAWARSNWQSGDDDIYILPDWRWLWALDATLVENNYDKILDDPGYYSDYHRSLISGVQRTRIETHAVKHYTHADGTPVSASSAGAMLDDETGTYFIEAEEHVSITFWEVKHKSYTQIFTSVSVEISDELFYYMTFESGAFGAGWGDLGNALGAFQFDRRYALPAFIDWCYTTSPDKYHMFETWVGYSTLPQGSLALEQAWIAAYTENPEDFTRMQYEYEIEHYCKPAWDIMADLGIDMSDRRDAVKGLVAGLCNGMGQAGLRHGISRLALSDSMSDLELAKAICAGVYNSNDLGADWLNAGKNIYLSAFQNRYRNELATIETLLTMTPSLRDANSTDAYSLLQLDIANNYAKAVRYVDIKNGKTVFNSEGYVKHLAFGSTNSFNGVTTDAQQRVVSAALSGDMFGKGKNSCQGWTEEVYRHVGISVPRYPCAREAAWSCAVSDDLENIPLGAAVFAGDGYAAGVNCGSHDAGHSGVYVGDGMIASNEDGGSIKLRSVESWKQWHKGGYWGWLGGTDLTVAA